MQCFGKRRGRVVPHNVVFGRIPGHYSVLPKVVSGFERGGSAPKIPPGGLQTRPPLLRAPRSRPAGCKLTNAAAFALRVRLRRIYLASARLTNAAAFALRARTSAGHVIPFRSPSLRRRACHTEATFGRCSRFRRRSVLDVRARRLCDGDCALPGWDSMVSFRFASVNPFG